jgi:hypothetical protein
MKKCQIGQFVKTNPIQTQYKPNTKPIQSQSNPIKANKMPIQTQYEPNQSQLKPIKCS